MLSFTGDTRAYCAFSKRIDFFFFSCGFSENQRLLELVWGPGDTVRNLISWEVGEKALISEERLPCYIYFFATFYRWYTSLLCLYDTYRFSLFLWVFSWNQTLLKLVCDPWIGLWAQYTGKWAKRPSFTIMLSFIGEKRAFCGFTKRIDSRVG